MALTREARVDTDVGVVRRCARPGCINALNPANDRFCSKRCAVRVQLGEGLGVALRIAPPPPDDEIKLPGQCARPGCDKKVKQPRNRYCSHACAAVQTGGDRWEKVAPRMRYTSEMREQDIRALYREEVSRSWK